MQPRQFALSTLIDVIWTALRGAGALATSIDFVEIFSYVALGLWALMGFKVFSQEALDIAAGKGIRLPQILITYGGLALFLYNWPDLANVLYATASSIAGAFFGSSDALLNNFLQAYANMQALDQATTDEGAILGFVSSLYNILIGSLVTFIGAILLAFSYALVLIMIAESFTTLGMTLVIGPVFLALALDESFRSYTFRWIGVILSHMLVIPLYGAALAIVAALVGASLPNFENLAASISVDHFVVQALSPLVSLGVLFHTYRLASVITGGGIGATGSLAYAIGSATARYLSPATASGVTSSTVRSTTAGAVRAATGRR